jgi:hypothetical protein
VPGGWILYQYPGPRFAGIGDNGAEASYYIWVDQHNTLELGPDVPISTGNENDALLALVDGKWVVMRVPYPLSFYAKGLDGRIDDSQCRLKRARGMDDERRPRTLAEGRRQGHGTPRLPFPVPPQLARQPTAPAAEPTRNNRTRHKKRSTIRAAAKDRTGLSVCRAVRPRTRSIPQP